MESSILQKIGIDPAYILIGMLVLIIALFVLLFILMGNIKNRNKQIKRLLSGTQAGDLEDIIMKRFAEMDALLDTENNGVVLNCMHTREGCFNYAKEIIGGEAYVALSEEEKEAIERAKTLEDEIAENKLK